MKKLVLATCCLLSLLLSVAGLYAQETYNDRAKRYIDTYCKMAIEEQKRSGVPAAVTLGQGILETEAGISELVTQANNHFGIKCKSDWQGDKFLHTDDAPDECFKKYSCAAESYKDHSDYLHRNQRYAKLFTLKPTDYKSWAVCLRQCGYATNPQYAQILIKIIENFNLQNYTLSAFDSSLLGSNNTLVMADEQDEEDNTPMQKIADSARSFMAGKIQQPAPAVAELTTFNDMKAFYANKGESLKPYAARYKISYARLLEMNDFPDAPLPFGCYVYLEKKQTLGERATHTVKEGETLLMISQMEGVQLRKLMAMNMLNPNEEPVAGAIIYLQSATAIKPDVKVNATIAHKTDAIVIATDTVKQDNDYISTKQVAVVTPPVVNHPDPGPAPVVPAPVVAAPAPVAATVTQPALRPVTDTPKIHIPEKHVIIVKMEEDIPRRQSVAEPAVAETQITPAPQDATSEEDFSKLKAELDQVVYADDSKMIGGVINPHTPQPKTYGGEQPNTGTGKYYTIKKGDTAFSIAKKNNITVAELYEWNDIDASGVKAGKTLRVK